MNADSFTGLSIAALLGGIRIISMATAGPMWMYKWFRLTPAWGVEGVIRRLRFALSKFDRLLLLRIVSPLKWFLVLVVLAWVVDNPINSDFGLAYMGTYAGLGCTAVLLGIFRKYRLKLKTYAAHEAVHRLSPALANELVIPFARSARGAYRLSAIGALRALGTPEARLMLQTFAQNGDAAIHKAAQQALDDLEGVFAGTQPILSVEPIGGRVRRHQAILQRFAKTKEAWHQHYDKSEVERKSDQIDEIVFSQLTLRRAFPHVYCKKCFARAERKTYEAWDWIHCRKCDDAVELTTGIVQVVGQIGGDDEWKVADGILKINLWDDAQRQVRIADIDALQIVGGKPINYEWAIAAVVQSLQKQSANPNVKVPVRISLDPPLDANSQRLLKTLKPLDSPIYP